MGIKIVEELLELIYPSNIYCICCGDLIDRTRPYALCDQCVRSLNWNNGYSCEKCGKRLLEEKEQMLCFDCSSQAHTFHKAFSCVEYGKAEKALIQRFKYKDEAHIGRKMSDMMYDRLAVYRELFQPELVIAVPMYKKKQRERGYNQAEILAKSLAKKLGVAYQADVLKRNRQTKPMNGLRAYERKENVKEAFSVTPGYDKIIKKKTILLVDDIYTTGSTMDGCSQVLLEKEAACVYAYAFASGANIDYSF